MVFSCEKWNKPPFENSLPAYWTRMHEHILLWKSHNYVTHFWICLPVRAAKIINTLSFVSAQYCVQRKVRLSSSGMLSAATVSLTVSLSSFCLPLLVGIFYFLIIKVYWPCSSVLSCFKNSVSFCVGLKEHLIWFQNAFQQSPGLVLSFKKNFLWCLPSPKYIIYPSVVSFIYL